MTFTPPFYISLRFLRLALLILPVTLWLTYIGTGDLRQARNAHHFSCYRSLMMEGGWTFNTTPSSLSILAMRFWFLCVLPILAAFHNAANATAIKGQRSSPSLAERFAPTVLTPDFVNAVQKVVEAGEIPGLTLAVVYKKTSRRSSAQVRGWHQHDHRRMFQLRVMEAPEALISSMICHGLF